VVNRTDRIRVAVQELRLVRSADMGPVYFHGETMRPFMGEGDLVIVEPVAWEAIRVGDIITYRSDDKFPTRRVVGIDRRAGTLVLRGDSIPGWPEFRVRREDVLGRAAVRVRNGVRVYRHGVEWRLAAVRALAIQRVALLVRAGHRLMRGGASRAARTLRLR
jgi:signal peptidase I